MKDLIDDFRLKELVDTPSDAHTRRFFMPTLHASGEDVKVVQKLLRHSFAK